MKTERRADMNEIAKTVAVMANQIANMEQTIHVIARGVEKINGGFRGHSDRLTAIETNCRNTIAADAGRFRVLFSFRDRLWVYLGIVASITGGLGFLAGRFVK